MALTKIQILSQSMSQLGLAPISSVDANNPQAVFASTAYDMLIESTLSNEDWRFATKLAQLSQLITPPPIDDYTFAYQIPGDFLASVRLIPQTFFQIVGDQIWTNVDGSQLVKGLFFEYRFRANEGIWPMYFVRYFIIALAEYLAIPLAEKLEYKKELEREKQKLENKAAFLDAQNHTNFPMRSNPFIEVRFGGQGIGSPR